MINNINLLENITDEALLSKFTNDSLVQALANLGQRIGIKGDSIAYKHSTFASLLETENGKVSYVDTASKLDPSKYIGLLRYK